MANPIVKEADASNKDKTRYFYTDYCSGTIHRKFLHTNTMGNDPNTEWVRQEIQKLWPGTTLQIKHWVEVSKSKFDELMKLPNACRDN